MLNQNSFTARSTKASLHFTYAVVQAFVDLARLWVVAERLARALKREVVPWRLPCELGWNRGLQAVVDLPELGLKARPCANSHQARIWTWTRLRLSAGGSRAAQLLSLLAATGSTRCH